MASIKVYPYIFFQERLFYHSIAALIFFSSPGLTTCSKMSVLPQTGILIEKNSTDSGLPSLTCWESDTYLHSSQCEVTPPFLASISQCYEKIHGSVITKVSLQTCFAESCCYINQCNEKKFPLFTFAWICRIKGDILRWNCSMNSPLNKETLCS